MVNMSSELGEVVDGSLLEDEECVLLCAYFGITPTVLKGLDMCRSRRSYRENPRTVRFQFFPPSLHGTQDTTGMCAFLLHPPTQVTTDLKRGLLLTGELWPI